MKLEFEQELGYREGRHEHSYLESDPYRPVNSDFMIYGQSGGYNHHLTGFTGVGALCQHHHGNFYPILNTSNPIVPGYPHLQQSMPNTQMSPYLSGINEQMLRNEHYFQHPNTPSPSSLTNPWTPAYSPELMSLATDSPQSIFSPDEDQRYPDPTSQHNMSGYYSFDQEHHSSSAEKTFAHVGEDEGPYDKPYAQLIYECLMQAPGHRMLLRDIYEWFKQNTCKARNSGNGCNGWQNSIRHNLSMNHAFENDKNDPNVAKGARKANSMWVLTAEAIEHGVESTTRFRKSNGSKKRGPNKIPAIQRQKSGAKGGRAAKHAARRRLQEQNRLTVEATELDTNNPAYSTFTSTPLPALHDEWSTYDLSPDEFSPETPNGYDELDIPCGLPGYSYYGYGEEIVPKSDSGGYIDEADQSQHLFWTPDDYYEDLQEL